MSETEPADDVGYPQLPATSWAVLGMLTLGEGLTGYDLKKWADWSFGYFYWSPSTSQVYGELKKLEAAGLVSSEQVCEPGERGRRVYRITGPGTRAVRNWSRDAPVEQPVLKHGLLLRMWMGHLNEPEHLKELVRAHIENMETLRERAAMHAANATREPSWAYSKMSLKWAERYYRAEIDLARQMLDDIDEAATEFAGVHEHDELGNPLPEVAGSWREVEDFVAGFEADGRS
ncbi:PadR family transcriptional regulator [Prescottella subtropica]|uniref:PadR family transcriptional regulator n=1 Tax=Prescottella subtropica TaxID=2545757 RepID=UPI0010F630BC|nr:PadR family transcriptional regulator [Prescottella subtropica]